jgi:hypothetical protein
MTRKDYVLIAEVLSNSAQSHALNPFTGESLFNELVRDFADALQGDNPRFNRARFLEACGVK